MPDCWREISQLELWSPQSIAITIFLVALNLLIVLDNGLVIISVMAYRRLHTTTNYIICSLATSDLFLGLLVLPFSVSQELLAGIWPFGELWCRAWLATDVWLCTASIFNLVAISCDRFLAVRYPLKYKLISSVNMGKILVALSWLFAFFICLPPLLLPLFGSEPKSNRTEENCRCTPMNNDSGYVIYSALGSFFIPLLLIILLNSSIYCTVKQAAKNRFRTLQCARESPNSSPHEAISKCSVIEPDPSSSPAELAILESPQTRRRCGTEPLLAREHQKQLERKRQRKTMRTQILNRAHAAIQRRQEGARAKEASAELKVAKTVTIVVGIFTVCWMPFSVIYALQAYDLCTTTSKCVPETVFTIAFWLGYSNSAINPIIYALFSRDLRWAFQQVARTVFGCHVTSRQRQNINNKTMLLSNNEELTKC